ncbi:hypothetical protein ACLESD_51390, partial [Pyxidicoccus sp. 3LFB2]
GARPGPGPWHFVVRRRGGGHEVLTAAPAVSEWLRKLSLRPMPVEEVPPVLLAEAQGRGWVRRG